MVCFRERGQGMVEYGLIVGLTAIIVIAVFVALGPQITEMFQQTVDEQSVGEGQSSVSAAIYGNGGGGGSDGGSLDPYQ